MSELPHGQPSVTLKNAKDQRMPAIGLGCWSGNTDAEHDSAKPWILSALKIGYRHLDTAHGYGTEHVVGQAVRESGIPREEIHVTTKLTSKHHHKVAESFAESLQRAQFDYYDLYLMHFPQATAEENDAQGKTQLLDVTFNETWAEMEKLLDTGKVKAIGVSNFSVKTLTELLKTAKVVPAVNQVEMHPYQTQPELLEFCNSKGIVLTAYSPTGYAPVREDETIVEIAAKHNVSPAQVSIAWHLARGTTAVPKSTNEQRQRGNLLELPKLTQAEVERISGLHKNAHLCGGPAEEHDGHKWVMGWTYEQMGW